MLTVVAAALLDPQGRACLQQRPLGKAHGGLWEFPGGKVEPGEGPEAALARELAEEMGIIVDPADFAPIAFSADAGEPEAGRPGLVILLYICRRWMGEPQCLEGEALGWFVPEAMAELPMPPLDVPLSRRLGELLSTGII